MDATNKLAPLFEVQLQLREPDIVFDPSLECNTPGNFKYLIKSIIDDIVKIAYIVERFSATSELSYLEEINNMADINEMKTEINQNAEKVIQQAFEYCESYQNYAYLWLDDRELYMQQFLEYSRQLTNEEMEYIHLKDPNAPAPNPPKMEAFREQIDNFEALYSEIENMETAEVFNEWFKVDIDPFKQALLNTVRKWGNMFKQHLVDTVTNNLCDLGAFIRSADEGLQQNVEEGNYKLLVSVMG